MPSSAEKNRALVLGALLAAAGIALGLLEAQWPLPLPIPGAKIGLANIATLICLYILPLNITVTVLLLRILAVALLAGTLASSTFFIALAGGGISLAVMLAAKKIPGLSPLGVSLAGSAAHNSGQLLMACLLINSTALFYYLPILLLLSIPAGLATGITAGKAIAILGLAKST